MFRLPISSVIQTHDLCLYELKHMSSNAMESDTSNVRRETPCPVYDPDYRYCGPQIPSPLVETPN